MKVLHLFQEYLSTSESWLFNLIDNIHEIEHAICPLYYNKQKEYFPSKLDFIKISNQELLYNLYKQPMLLSFLKRYKSIILRKFIRKEITQIKEWVLKNQPSLIHLHFATTASHFLPLLSQLEIPFLVSFYGYDYNKALKDDPRLKESYKQIFKKATFILIEENGAAQYLLDMGCPKQKIKTIRLGVRVDEIKYRNLTNRTKCKIIQIANFTPKKGQLDLVKMIEKYQEKLRPKVKVTFLGDSETTYGKKIRKLVQENHLNDIISFKNGIPYSEIHSTLSQYDLFIHPSKHAKDGDCEGGAPTILLDAQAVGLPIISTEHCDIPSYVINNTTGILVKENNIDDLFAGLNRVLKMPNTLLKQMSSSGRKHVEQNYNIKNNAMKLRDLYLSINNH